ncbi:threonine/serine exporter family protein [Arthrobacter monumenti]
MEDKSSKGNVSGAASGGGQRPDPSTLQGQQSAKPPSITRSRPSPARLAGGKGRESDARRVLRRLVRGETPRPPQSLVDSLGGGPYAQAKSRAVADTDSRETVDLALRVAEGMLRFGAGALEAESSIVAIAAAYGLREIEVDITNQSVKVNYPDTSSEPVSMMRVVRSWSQNYAGLAYIHQLVRKIATGELTRPAALQELQDIMTRPKPFAKWMVIAASATAASALTGVLGGGLVDCMAAIVITLIVQFLARQLGSWRLPEFFTMAACSAFITLAAIAILRMGLPAGTGFIVAGGIILLLPTGRVISATQDAIYGFPVTAAGRFSSAFLVLGGLVSGIAVGVVTGALLGSGRIDVTEEGAVISPFLLGALLVLASAMLAIAEQTKPSYVLPTAAIGLAGLLVMNGYIALGVGNLLAPAVGATVVGIGSRLVASWMHTPQLVLAVPAVTFLLPGLLLFRSMYGVTVESVNSVEGFVGLFNALTVTLSIAGGVVLGDNLARPLTTEAGWQERRRNRRR